MMPNPKQWRTHARDAHMSSFDDQSRFRPAVLNPPLPSMPHHRPAGDRSRDPNASTYKT
jgi:hypothetical protein